MRKDNELLMGLRALGEEEMRARMRDQAYQMMNIAYKEEKPLTEPQKRRKVHFRDYLTEIDCTSPCERLPDDYQNHLDRKYTKKTDGRAAFREWAEALDKDKAWIEKTERELF